ncbi:MAG: hypothetical protein IJQ73_02100 [Kiritimatiellae bacterium]|nr:hypothetical protein [Kiritimatiellia bacterium]
MKCKLILAAAVAAMASSGVFAAGRTMLAIPARHDMVYFGFDMLKQLPGSLELACYKGDEKIERLEVFDKGSREWVTISPEAWASGAYRADSLVIAGENAAASRLQALSSWTKRTSMASDRSKLEVVKAVNAFQPLSETQWLELGRAYDFKFTQVQRPSLRERLRDEARARRAAEKARKQDQVRAFEEARAAEKARRAQLIRTREETEAAAKAQREAELLRAREEAAAAKAQREAKLLRAREEAAAAKAQREAELLRAREEAAKVQEKTEGQGIVLRQNGATTSVNLVAPVEAKPEVAPVQVIDASAVEAKPADKTLAAPFDGSSAITDMPPALEDAAKLKAAEEVKAPAAPEVKAPVAPEVKAPAAPEVKAPVAPEVKAPAAPEVKAPATPEVKAPAASEADIKAAVEAAVQEAAAKSTPVAAEIRVPTKEVVAPKTDAAVEVKVPEVKSVEVAVPAAPTAQPAAVVEVKVPEVKPVEVSVPATPAAPEVQPVKTPEIKVPAIVLDPM